MLHFVIELVLYKKSEKYKMLGPEEKEYKDQTMWDDHRMLAEEIEEIRTEQLQREAAKHNIPIPYEWKSKEYEKYWQEDLLRLSKYLTAEGYHKLRKDIREEKKDRLNEKLAWVPIVSGLSGLFAIIAVVISMLTFGLQQTPVLILNALQISEGQQRIYFYFQNVGNIGVYQLKGAYAITAHDEPEIENTANEKVLAFGTLDIKDEAFYPGKSNVALITRKVELKEKISKRKQFVYFSLAINYPRLQMGPFCIGKKGYEGVFMFDSITGRWVASTRTHLPKYFQTIFDALKHNKSPRFSKS